MISFFQNIWYSPTISLWLQRLGIIYISYYSIKYLITYTLYYLKIIKLDQALQKSKSKWVVLFNFDQSTAETLLTFRGISQKKYNTLFLLRKEAEADESLNNKI